MPADVSYGRFDRRGVLTVYAWGEARSSRFRLPCPWTELTATACILPCLLTSAVEYYFFFTFEKLLRTLTL
jgi:hypothetical protein